VAEVLEAAGEHGLPILIHTADPVAFFEPLDRHNERLDELIERPDWWFGRPGLPSFARLMAALESAVAAHPATTFIGAHVGCAAEDLGRVSTILERCSNFHVDIAARLGELGRQPYTARAFFLRWADRILYGTDVAPEPAISAIHARFLETFDESFDYGTDDPPSQGRWQIHGIGLPDDVLAKVYAANAERLIRFADQG
jgi:predicted TIM-barrel fold metal-dependent hydrolase